jgi:hypothetical protein
MIKNLKYPWMENGSPSWLESVHEQIESVKIQLVAAIRTETCTHDRSWSLSSRPCSRRAATCSGEGRATAGSMGAAPVDGRSSGRTKCSTAGPVASLDLAGDGEVHRMAAG